MAPSGFHLWQFEVFNYGAGGLLVILFWLDLWEIFSLSTLGFEMGTSESLVLHSTFEEWELLDMISDNLRYLTLVWRDWWCYCSDWTCERFSFCLHWGLNWGPALYHCSMATSGFHLWQFEVFNYGAGGFLVILFWLDLWEIFSLSTPGFEMGTSESLVLHSTFEEWQLLDFTSDNLRYLTLVWRDWWCYCSDWTCERFSFGCTRVWTGDLWISTPVLYQCTMVTSHFHLWQFEVFNSGVEGLVLVLCWFYLWEIFFLSALGFELGTCGSLVLHSTTAPCWLVVFTSDNVRYLTLVSEGLVVVLFWLDLWEIFFLPMHFGLNWGPVDL